MGYMCKGGFEPQGNHGVGRVGRGVAARLTEGYDAAGPMPMPCYFVLFLRDRLCRDMLLEASEGLLGGLMLPSAADGGRPFLWQTHNSRMVMRQRWATFGNPPRRKGGWARCASLSVVGVVVTTRRVLLHVLCIYKLSSVCLCDVLGKICAESASTLVLASRGRGKRLATLFALQLRMYICTAYSLRVVICSNTCRWPTQRGHACALVLGNQSNSFLSLTCSTLYGRGGLSCSEAALGVDVPAFLSL